MSKEAYDAVEAAGGVTARLLAELDDGRVVPATLAAYVRGWETPVDVEVVDEEPAKPAKATAGKGGK